MALKDMGLVPLIIDIDDDIIKPLFAKEGDYQSRGISLQILDKGKEIDTTGIIVEFFAKPRDGKVYVVEATPVDATKGKYEIVYPSSILQPGIVKCEIRLVKMTDDEIDEIITTKSFNLKVYETIADEDIFEGIDIEPIVEILVQAARNEEERIAAENERIQAENARKSSENTRELNEQTRIQNENIRQSNEQTRQQNEAIRQQNEQQRIDLYNALKDLDVSQYELRLQNVENQVNIDNFLLEEWDEPVISLPSDATNGQINEIKIFGNTEAEEDNVKSTFGAIRLKSVGKNLFDGELELGQYNARGNKIINDNAVRNKNTIKVEPNTNYRLSGFDKLSNFVLRDKNKNIITRIFSTNIINTTNETHYIDFWNDSVSLDANVMFEKGDTATEYEPYKESTLYVIAKDEEGNILELRSLPNGVKDEINVANRKLIKRIGEKANVSSGTVINYTDMAEGGTYYAWNDNGETETGNKGDILGIDATVLIYQLANPIEIPVEVFGNLQSYEKGTVYIDTIIPKVSFYDGANGIQVTVPIKAIDTLHKVDKETGYLHPLDISQAVIAEDRLSFTHPELTDGDLVDWDYEPALESTNPAISMKLPTNLKASINSNIKKIGELSDKVDNLNTRTVAAHKNIQDVQNEFNEHKEEFNTHKADFKEYKQIYIPGYIKGNKMKYIGHRGVAMIAPEDTIPSFEKAGELGFWATEADCIVTKDGEWVILHDTTVDRMTNGTGNIQDMTLSQVRGLTIDAGANINLYPNLKIPTLEEFLDVCLKWNLVPIIETKGTVNASNLQSLIDLIKAKGLINKVIISSLSLSHLTEIRNIDKNVFVEYAVYNFNSSVIDTLKALGNAMLSLPYTSINQSIMYQCFSNNILVSAWTVNDYNIAKSLEKLGVAQIYSDILC